MKVLHPTYLRVPEEQLPSEMVIFYSKQKHQNCHSSNLTSKELVKIDDFCDHMMVNNFVI
jgi:hypothetical protein